MSQTHEILKHVKHLDAKARTLVVVARHGIFTWLRHVPQTSFSIRLWTTKSHEAASKGLKQQQRQQHVEHKAEKKTGKTDFSIDLQSLSCHSSQGPQGPQGPRLPKGHRSRNSARKLLTSSLKPSIFTRIFCISSSLQDVMHEIQTSYNLHQLTSTYTDPTHCLGSFSTRVAVQSWFWSGKIFSFSLKAARSTSQCISCCTLSTSRIALSGKKTLHWTRFVMPPPTGPVHAPGCSRTPGGVNQNSKWWETPISSRKWFLFKDFCGESLR